MGVDPALKNEIVRRITGVAQPARIILFGSAAAGETNDDSDIDLLVLENGAFDPRGETVRILNALRGMGVPFDVIVMTAERFEETKDVIGGIAFPANKKGVVIYEAA
jgi:predicted nucleotidyltransferase